MKRILEISTLLLGLAGLVLLIIAARNRLRPAPAVEPIDTGRRQFLNRALLGSLGLFGAALGAGSISFIWPHGERSRGFGSRIDVGTKGDILYAIERDGVYYNVRGKFYIVRYETSDPDNVYVRDGVAKAGLLTVYQKCSHLGCRVPYCPTSGWFECPCHDALFNHAGEVMSGPAPASMWHFPIDVQPNGRIFVDATRPVSQQKRNFETAGVSPGGEHCVQP